MNDDSLSQNSLSQDSLSQDSLSQDSLSQDSLSQNSMDEETLPLYWYEIRWPIRGHLPHFEMTHEIYDELVKTYPSININVEQELISAYAYMKDRFPGCSEGGLPGLSPTGWRRMKRLSARPIGGLVGQLTMEVVYERLWQSLRPVLDQ
ncbi:hypothetical protein [Endozoicomonas ascidiicola]|uniref:hypothetical protein n=2 Tax=Endozoicomonas ascidiicola TaxID=1698521 RepID=UPI000833D20E|nr:hypothetical protein [Endozoicomonas ascidiicola]